MFNQRRCTWRYRNEHRAEILGIYRCSKSRNSYLL